MARKKEGRKVPCLECGKSFYLPPSKMVKRGKFCSKSCYFKFVHNAKDKYLKNRTQGKDKGE